MVGYSVVRCIHHQFRVNSILNWHTRPLPRQVHPPAQQIAGGAPLGGVGVSLWYQSALEQERDLLGIDLIILGLSAMDRSHIQGVAQHKGKRLPTAEIGDPIPGEDAPDGDRQVVLVSWITAKNKLRQVLIF